MSKIFEPLVTIVEPLIFKNCCKNQRTSAKKNCKKRHPNPIECQKCEMENKKNNLYIK
jgi:hypothetical protein